MKRTRLLVFILTVTLMLSITTFADIVKYGSSGAEVKKIQTQLKTLGLFKGSITGYFGSETKASVKKFQQKNRLTADGIVGAKTSSVLFKPVNTTTSSNRSKTSSSTQIEQTKKIQTVLKQQGLYKGKIDGIAGKLTTAAIKAFQSKNDLKATGKLDKLTESKILSIDSKQNSVSSRGNIDRSIVALTADKTGNSNSQEDPSSETEQDNITENIAEDVETDSDTHIDDDMQNSSDSEDTPVQADIGEKQEPEAKGVEMLDWWKDASKIFNIGTKAKVTDVRTGITFNIVRTYGSKHADSETLTKEDTAAMKKAWGGSWNWIRRPVIVEIDGRRIAASIAAMPHAGVDSAKASAIIPSRSGGYGRGNNLDKVKNNNMDGVVDVHFFNSRTHGTNRVDKNHQSAIKEAARRK